MTALRVLMTLSQTHDDREDNLAPARIGGLGFCTRLLPCTGEVFCRSSLLRDLPILFQVVHLDLNSVFQLVQIVVDLSYILLPLDSLVDCSNGVLQDVQVVWLRPGIAPHHALTLKAVETSVHGGAMLHLEQTDRQTGFL